MIPSISPEEFGQKAFVQGEARGLRSFHVSSEGWLTGMTYPQIWTGGVNEATCYENTGQSVHQANEAAVYAKPSHDLDECTIGSGHGFYAYYETETETWAADGKVHAIIKGSGETIIGSLGFRTMKAELLALVVETPKFEGPTMVEVLRKLLDRYAGIPRFDSIPAMLKEFPVTKPEEFDLLPDMPKKPKKELVKAHFVPYHPLQEIVDYINDWGNAAHIPHLEVKARIEDPHYISSVGFDGVEVQMRKFLGSASQSWVMTGLMDGGALLNQSNWRPMIDFFLDDMVRKLKQLMIDDVWKL